MTFFPKAHREHLVDDEYSRAASGEVDVAPAQVVDQAPVGRHDDLRAAVERADLRPSEVPP